jgi:hypothetical protein
MQLASVRKALIVFALAVGGLIALPASASPASIADSSAQLLVAFRSTAQSADIAGALNSAGATDRSVIQRIGVHVVSVDNADHALAALRSNPNVFSAERDSLLQPQEVLPNDPYFLYSGAWNLGGGAWGWYATHTTQAWDIAKGDPSVQIAILDTGIKPNGLTDFEDASPRRGTSSTIRPTQRRTPGITVRMSRESPRWLLAMGLVTPAIALTAG